MEDAFFGASPLVKTFIVIIITENIWSDGINRSATFCAVTQRRATIEVEKEWIEKILEVIWLDESLVTHVLVYLRKL